MEQDNSQKKLGGNNGGNLTFYIPFLFALHTRFLRRSKLGVLVWATEYLFPVFIALLIIGWSHFDFINAIVTIAAVYNFYEIGYIQNDCETIKKEVKPTKRVTDKQLEYYEAHKFAIYSFRIILGIVCSWYFVEKCISFYSIAIMWMIIPYYAYYNSVRGRINLYMLLLLTAYRYCVPLLLYAGNIKPQSLWIMLSLIFIAYPLPKWIEVCADGKGNPPETWTKLFMKDFGGRFVFRIKYYAILSILCIIGWIIDWLPISIIIIPIYYLLDRIPQLKMKKLGAK